MKKVGARKRKKWCAQALAFQGQPKEPENARHEKV